MKKKQKTKQRTVFRAPEEDASDALDWTPLFSAFKQAFEWALDVAEQLARDYPEEDAAEERVRTFMERRIGGLSADVRVDDVLFTFGLIIGAIDRDLGPVDTLGPWFGIPLHLPSAAELWERTIPHHLYLAQRLASSLRFATA